MCRIDITWAQPDRRPVIDSLPFQEGSFELDLSGWSHDNDPSIQNAGTSLQPLPPGERAPALDVVRGSALFGVLLAYTLRNLVSRIPINVNSTLAAILGLSDFKGLTASLRL
jgi:hypothetical protein